MEGLTFSTIINTHYVSNPQYGKKNNTTGTDVHARITWINGHLKPPLPSAGTTIF